MRQREARGQQPEGVEVIDHAVRMGRVGPGALIPRLQEVHVDAAATALRLLGDRRQQCVAAPLHAIGPELHVEHRAGRRGDNLVE